MKYGICHYDGISRTIEGTAKRVACRALGKRPLDGTNPAMVDSSHGATYTLRYFGFRSHIQKYEHPSPRVLYALEKVVKEI